MKDNNKPKNIFSAKIGEESHWVKKPYKYIRKILANPGE